MTAYGPGIFDLCDSVQFGNRMRTLQGSAYRSCVSPIRLSRCQVPVRRIRSLLTLAIETSCDDTSVAVLEKLGKIERSSGSLGSDCESIEDLTSTVRGQSINRSSEARGDDANLDWRPASKNVSKPKAVLYFHKRITSDNRKFRGIHPMIALDSHQTNLAKLVQEACNSLPPSIAQEDQCTNHIRSIPVFEPSSQKWQWKQRPDCISVTRGPGLKSNLATGVDIAKGLAVAWQIPLVGVHHMQAHALTPRLASALRNAEPNPPNEDSLLQTAIEPEFPFLSLLVSGGHSLLLHTTSLTSHSILATTADIALGDCLDKCAREILPASLLAASSDTMYGLLLESFVFPYQSSDYAYVPPARRAEELARKPTEWGWALAAPLAETRSGSKSKSMEYSFTGTSSAIRRIVERRVHEGGMSETERRDLGREAMRVVFEHLASRVIMALSTLTGSKSEDTVGPVQTVVVSGGVASNKFLRHILRVFLDVRGFGHVELAFPPTELCTDNAAMIGWAGIEMFEAGWVSELGIRAVRKWSLDAEGEERGILGMDGWTRREIP